MLIAEFSHKGEEIEIENELWQYDYGQRIQIKGLDLPETFEVHFAWKDSEKAKVVIGSTVNGISTVDIPNVALEQRRTITAYIYLSGITEGETVNTIILSVNKRKAPENFGTPEDVDLFHHTLAATAEYQRQAKESEKQAAARSADAEAWAHGREDHPDQEQDNAKYYAEQAAASQQAAELLQQRVSDLATQAQNNIGEAQQQAIKTITEQQGISIQKIKNQTAESEDNLKNTIRAAEQIKTDLDTEVENATPIKQGLDDSNTAAIKTKVDLDKSNTIADQIKAELEVLNTTASKTKTNLDGANKIATDLTGTLENEISEGIQTKIDIQTTAEKAMSNLQAEATKQQEFIKTSIDDTLSISGKAADAAVTGKKIDSLKEDISEISKKQGHLSSYVTDSTIKIDNEIYDVTTIIDELLKKDVKKIVVDVDCYVQKSIIPKNGIEIVGNGKSVIYFESGDGFNFSEGSDNTSIHDLIIKGYNIQDDVKVKDNWIINISSDLHNVKLYNLDIESGYNGIKINGWINNYQNIIVSYFKGIGVYIGRSDNTFNTFYINGCRKEGLYISSSNNRIDNIKILSCGKNSDSSCFFKGNRNTISNVEIQDIYNKCAIFEDFNNNILNINLDGIRTHITDDASIVLAEFVNCSRNVINLISSKYGSSVNDSSKDDIISLNSNCNTNSLILSSLKVALQDGGAKNNITVLKNDIVSYNIDKILTLEEKYSVKKPTVINYVGCSDISNEYNDAMYAFKNSGNVTYSGPRFTLKEKQKLFCVVVLSSNTAYTEQTQATLMLTDQQDNINSTKSIGNLENNQVLTLIGADDASLFPWAVLNSAMNSSTITKIKYIGFLILRIILP